MARNPRQSPLMRAIGAGCPRHGLFPHDTNRPRLCGALLLKIIRFGTRSQERLSTPLQPFASANGDGGSCPRACENALTIFGVGPLMAAIRT